MDTSICRSALLLLFAHLALVPQLTVQGRPNVVLIMTDDQGIGDFGVMGNPIIETPNIDALATTSASLSTFYVSPVCSPTRACLMTGRYNYRTRCIDTYVGRSMLEPEEVTVAEELSGAGYATGIFGKWHLGDCYPMLAIDQGFDEALLHRGGGLAQVADPRENHHRYTDAILMHNGQQVQTSGYCTDVYFDATLKFIEQAQDNGKHFFGYLPTNAPHSPYHDVPEDWRKHYQKKDLRSLIVGKIPQAQVTGEVDKLSRIASMITNIDRALNKVAGNTIADVGGQGISFATTGERGRQYLCGPSWKDPENLRQQSKLFPKVIRNLVSNNHIHHTGQIEGHGAGIMVWGLNSIENVISRNLVHHTPHAGITVQDGFSRVIVEYNKIHDVCLELADNGGIFFNRWFVVEQDDDLKAGNIVRYNLVRDVVGCGAYGKPRTQVEKPKAGGRIWAPYFTWGIYFDNSLINASVYGNICVGNTLGGIFFSDMAAKDVVVENNIFAESSVQQMDLPRGGGGNRNRRNIVYYSSPRAAFIKTNKGESIAECDFNVYFQTAGAKRKVTGVENGSFLKWREIGFDTHSKVTDPMFVDFESGDYRLKAESPALALGFK